MPSGEEGARAHRQLRRPALSVAVGAHGAFLLASVPVLVLMVAFSLFEGGDVALKQRLQSWAGIALLGNLACGTLLVLVAIRFLRGLPVSSGVTAVAAGLLMGLGAGWVWVSQGLLLSDPSVLGTWVVLTMPALVAFGVWRLRR